MKAAALKSFRCACGEIHEFSAWVYAHWNEKLEHRCSKCQRINHLLAGHVTNPPKAKRKVAR